ncbi:MAG: LysM peptidoglycan-binding domain-containing protein [Dongiaceae bacterium]
MNIVLDRAFYTKEEKISEHATAETQLAAQREAAEKIDDPLKRQAALSKWREDVDQLAETLICQNPVIRGRRDDTGPQVDGVALCGSSTFDERGYTIHDPVKNLLLNIIGVVTFNIGSKWILDTYRSKLSDARSAVDHAFSANLPGRSELIGQNEAAEAFLGSMRLRIAESRFALRSINNENYDAFYYVARHPEGTGIKIGTFCRQVRPVIKQYARLLSSTVIGDQQYTVDRNSSLWKIAENAYGSGFYFLTLLPPNDIAIKKANRLAIGTVLKVPAMYKIWTGQDRPVRIGESLWGIARHDLGSDSAYQTILEQNGKFIERPNRIYPIQLLQLQQ